MITRPTLIVDEAKCRQNINRMAEKAKRNGISLRPHFKTHQSRVIGGWIKEAGVTGITVSSVKMAEYFAPDWDDITIAFPLNILEIPAIESLANSRRINVIVENEESINALSGLSEELGVFVNTNIGYNRTGVNPEAIALIQNLIDLIESNDKLSFKGFLGHAGHSYTGRSNDEVLAIHEASCAKMRTLKSEFIEAYPNLVASVGDTPTCSVAEDFSGLDEMRPGNFVFYDLMMVQITACTNNEIAVALGCPVVAVYPEKNVVIVHGGGVHFSKDKMTYEGQEIFGRVVKNEEGGWSNPIEDAYLSKISQEHGTVTGPDEFIASIKIGDILKVLPIHSCMTADLMDGYITTAGFEFKD